ncbi:RnfH family protein [Microbulbifer sp. YPW16]|uniref:RnfH family protein n=1 Tax=Microbulbifer sp. YPW16 TaxID=2904242 RepID=UPI001E3DE99E|nr:RnfH family protein [Microbulbifer sp. YPW16]UHQ56632.1 RnfH family protein [Microbulbifer sp. YPW16]
MTDMKTIAVEVVYALPHEQRLVSLLVPPGTTATEALVRSGLPEEYPGIDPATARLGIFGQALGTKGLAVADQYELKPGDRVEVYRPLIADPKEARKQRAEKARRKAQEAGGKAD